MDAEGCSTHPVETGDNITSIVTCSMCCKRFKPSFVTNLDVCGHKICKVCIIDWNEKTGSHTCPFCQSLISDGQIDIICSYTQDSSDYLDDVGYEKIHQSSGGILIRRVVGTIYYLAILQRRRNGELQWVAPKGQIEGSENSLEAATREISEETGLKNITLIDFVGKECFSFRESGKLYKKKIFWYLFYADQPGELVLNEEEGFFKSKWITYEDSLNMFSHKSFIEIIKLADNILKKS